MKQDPVTEWIRFAAVTALSAMITVAALTAVAHAADISADTLKFNNGVAKAANGYETLATNYIVANPTSVFSDHFYYGGPPADCCSKASAVPPCD